MLWIAFLGLSHAVRNDPGGGRHFRLSYLFQMDLKGHILLMVPHRSYFEAAASIELTADQKDGGHVVFGLSSVDRTGYLLTTGGLTATSLYFFTADSSEERRRRFYRRKLEQFRRQFPLEFSRFRKIRNRPMSILSLTVGDFSFERDPAGVHRNIRENMTLSDSHSGTYANIYAILAVLVKSFNHGIFPEEPGSQYPLTPGRVWNSTAVDYSGLLAETARLTSQYAEREIRPRQKRPVVLGYRVKDVTDSRIFILGRSASLPPLWKGMRLRSVEREIIMDRKSRDLIRDEVRFDIWGGSQKTGRIHVCLERLDR